MKRFLVSILAVLYLATASVATVHLHYCMGHLITASLLDDSKDEHDCSKCGMSKKSNNGCCKDEHKVLKANQEHQVSKLTVETIKPFISQVLLPTAIYKVAIYKQTVRVRLLAYTPTDRWRHCPIYIQVQNFRI